MISRVLLAVKPGYLSSSSVKRAKELASAASFDLMLYSAVHEDSVARSSFGTAEALKNIEKSMLDSEQQRLEEIRSHFEGLCKSVEIRTAWQAPIAQGIVQAAEAFNADLIILACSHHGRIRRLFLTNTDWDVVRQSAVPVLVSQDPDPKGYSKILAAVDPTHQHDKLEQLDKNVLEVSKYLQRRYEAELYLGHVFPDRESSAMDHC